VPRPHRCHPVFRLAFTFTHSGFRRPRRDRRVRENPDPKLALTLHAAGEPDTRRLDLRVRDPRPLQPLKPELTKIGPQITRRRSLAASPLGLPVLHAFWHQWHVSLSSIKNFSYASTVSGVGGN